METYIENVKKLGDDPSELKIVKHYAMKFMDKKKWTNMVRNRARWEKGGACDVLFKTILAQHYHFIGDGNLDVMTDPNATISRKKHIRSMRDWWEEEVEDREKEIEELREEGNTITKKEHKDIVKQMEKEHKRDCDAMEDTIISLKNRLSFAEDKRKSQEDTFEKQLAFREKTEQAMERAHEAALKDASS